MNCLKPFVWRTIRTIHYKPKLTFLGGSRRTRPNSDYRLMTRSYNKKRLTEELLWSKKGTVRLLFNFIHLDTERKDRCVCGTIKIPVHFFPPFDRKKKWEILERKLKPSYKNFFYDACTPVEPYLIFPQLAATRKCSCTAGNSNFTSSTTPTWKVIVLKILTLRLYILSLDSHGDLATSVGHIRKFGVVCSVHFLVVTFDSGPNQDGQYRPHWDGSRISRFRFYKRNTSANICGNNKLRNLPYFFIEIKRHVLIQ